MTPEDITRERALAARLMQPDFSPVSHWTQGLGRVAQNLVGALDARDADRASERNAADNQRIIEALMGGGGQAATAGTPAVLPSTGRPMLPNADGTVSTEESITITDPRINGGAATNINSIWNGQRLDQEAAIAAAVASGQTFPSFPSIDAATAAARARSDALGAEVRGLPVAAQSGAPTAPAGFPPSPAGAPQINPAVLQALTSPYASEGLRQLATLQYRAALEAQNRRPNEPPEFIQLLQAANLDPASTDGQAMLRRYVEQRADPVVSIPLRNGQTYIGPRSMLPGTVGAGGMGAAPPATLPPNFDFGQGGPTRDGSGGFP